MAGTVGVSFSREQVALWVSEALRQGDTYASLASRSGVSERTLYRVVSGGAGGSKRWRGLRVRIDTADRIALATDHELWELDEFPYHGAATRTAA